MSGQNPVNRRAVLWNVQLPGDAYDIRKSMIAKLPEHPPRFMGDNLQIVCLFQAAEIQRLSQFLEEITIQMRTFERMQLDRHSYEIQIKQLAEKLQLANQYKNENAKLRQFIKGQSEQLQGLQKHRNSSQNLIELQKKYESVLNQLRICRDNYSVLQRANNQTIKQLSQWKFKYERVQKTLQQERQSRDKQIRFANQRALIESHSISEQREYQLKGEISVIKQSLVLKNREIELQKARSAQLSKMLIQKQELITKYMRGEIQVQGNKTQQFLRISKRLQESTYYLQQKEKSIINLKDEISYLNKRVKQFEEDLKKKEEEIRKKDFQIKNKDQAYSQNSQLLAKIGEGQRKLALLSSDYERIKEVVASKERDILEKERQLSFFKDKSLSYERTVEFLQKEIKEKQTIIRKIQIDSKIFEDKDNKIAALGGEIQRLNMVMRQKLNELARMQSYVNELSQAKNQNFILLRAKDQAIRVLQQRGREYDIKVNSLEESNKLNFDEINRLNLKLANLQNQNVQLRRQIEMRFQSSSQLGQLRSQISTLNEQLNNKTIQNCKLREDNELMFKEIHQFEDRLQVSQKNCNQLRILMAQKLQQKDHQFEQFEVSFMNKEKSYIQKIDMYSKSMPKMSVEIQRLHQLLEKRQSESKRLQEDLDIERQKNRIIQRRNSTQIEMRIIEYERNVAFYESKCKNLQQVNTEMSEQKNKIIQKVQTLQMKLRESQTQLDKIISALKVKEATFQEHQKRTLLLQDAVNQLRDQNLKLQGEVFKNRQELELNLEIIRKSQFEADSCKRELNKSRTDYSNLMNEFNRVKVTFQESQSKNPLLIEQLQSLKHQLAKAENERQHLINEINERKRRGQSYESDIRNLQLKVQQYQQSIKHIEQANSIKFEQTRQRLMEEFESKLRAESIKYNKLEERYRQLQQDYKNTESQQKNQVQNLEQQNNELRHHLNEYQQKVFSYEERIALLSQEIQRLSFQNSQQKRTISEYQQQYQGNTANNEAMRGLNSELERTRIELTNLKQMLYQYESINEHAVAERDELFNITHEQEETISNLKQENHRLNHQLQSQSMGQVTYETQISTLKQQYNIIYSQLLKLKQEHSQATSQLQHANKRAAETNSITIRDKDIKINQLQNTIQKVTQQYEAALKLQRQKKDTLSAEMEKKSRALLIMQQQSNQLRQRLEQLQGKVSSEQQIQIQMEELKTEYINIKLQNQELNRMLEQMHEQLFQAKEQNTRINQEQTILLINENNQLKFTLEQERQTLSIINQKLSSLSSQIQQTRAEADQEIRKLQSNYLLSQQQNNSLKQQLEAMQVQMSQISVYQQISLDWESKYNLLYQTYEETYKNYNQMLAESDSLKENLRMTESKIPRLNEEFEKLNAVIGQLRNEIISLKEQNQQLRNEAVIYQNDINQVLFNTEQLQKQLQRVYELNHDLTEQVAQIRLRLSDQHALEEKIRNNMMLFVMLCAQIDSLRKRVQQTEQQCEVVRRSSISPIKIKK